MAPAELLIRADADVHDGRARYPPDLQPVPRSSWSSSRLSDRQFAWLLTLPVFIGLLAIVGYPTLYSLWMSFHRVDLIFKRTEFVGLQNYQEALTSPAFAHAFSITVYYTALVTIFALVIAVGGALILNEKFRGRGFVMAIVILPWAVSLYATAIVWKYLYSPDWGHVQRHLAAARGHRPPDQLSLRAPGGAGGRHRPRLADRPARHVLRPGDAAGDPRGSLQGGQG